jgi:branched-chain amino acid transport system substrate-binding protein
MAQFAANRLQARTAVVFTDITSDYSIGLSRIFQEHFRKTDGRILKVIEYKRSQEDYTHLIRDAKQADADVMFLSGHDESPVLSYHAQEAGVRSIPLGGDGWMSNFYTRKGDLLRRGYFTAHWTKDIGNVPSKQDVAQPENPENLEASGALAYDAVMVVADAVSRAGTTDRRLIRDALAETKDFKGITGTISFDAQGDPVKSAAILEIHHGNLRFRELINPNLK